MSSYCGYIVVCKDRYNNSEWNGPSEVNSDIVKYWAYSGVICERAGTSPGHVYTSRNGAERAARRLAAASKKGFRVVPVSNS